MFACFLLSQAPAAYDHGVVPDLASQRKREVGTYAGATTVGDEGPVLNRKERVERYKEKRRTREFCKKIRYEVRKANAERRPRIKVRASSMTFLCAVQASGQSEQR